MIDRAGDEVLRRADQSGGQAVLSSEQVQEVQVGSFRKIVEARR